jgi:hypothetical protein
VPVAVGTSQLALAAPAVACPNPAASTGNMAPKFPQPSREDHDNPLWAQEGNSVSAVLIFLLFFYYNFFFSCLEYIIK